MLLSVFVLCAMLVLVLCLIISSIIISISIIDHYSYLYYYLTDSIKGLRLAVRPANEEPYSYHYY